LKPCFVTHEDKDFGLAVSVMELLDKHIHDFKSVSIFEKFYCVLNALDKLYTDNDREKGYIRNDIATMNNNLNQGIRVFVEDPPTITDFLIKNVKKEDLMRTAAHFGTIINQFGKAPAAFSLIINMSDN
jgi:hypothetical protein